MGRSSEHVRRRFETRAEDQLHHAVEFLVGKTIALVLDVATRQHFVGLLTLLRNQLLEVGPDVILSGVRPAQVLRLDPHFNRGEDIGIPSPELLSVRQHPAARRSR